MTTEPSAEALNPEEENSIYELFMGLMTIASLVVMIFIVVVRVPEAV